MCVILRLLCSGKAPRATAEELLDVAPSEQSVLHQILNVYSEMRMGSKFFPDLVKYIILVTSKVLHAVWSLFKTVSI
jgi:hypothetical protein